MAKSYAQTVDVDTGPLFRPATQYPYAPTLKRDRSIEAKKAGPGEGLPGSLTKP